MKESGFSRARRRVVAAVTIGMMAVCRRNVGQELTTFYEVVEGVPMTSRLVAVGRMVLVALYI